MPGPAKRAPRRTPAEMRERMPRRTPSETRDLMLSAAVELIRDRAEATGDDALSAALAHVRLTQVAERATDIVRERTGDQKAKAITTGALYQQWPSQSDFQVDLLFHIAHLQATLVPGLAESILRFKQAHASSVPLADLFFETMEEVHRHYREDPLYRVEMSLLVGACDPRLRAALARRQSEFYEAADQAWQAMLTSYDLRIRPPYTIRDLSRAIAAQVAGSVVIWFADPEILRDPEGQQGRSLMSRSMLAVFEWLTEPVTAEDNGEFGVDVETLQAADETVTHARPPTGRPDHRPSVSRRSGSAEGGNNRLLQR